jgi:hypothetical protein
MPRRRLTGIRCPICRHLVLELDESGCLIEGREELSPCRHYLGLGDEDLGACMEPGFECIGNVREAVSDYFDDGEPDQGMLLAALEPILPNAAALVRTAERTDGLMWHDWIELLPDVHCCANAWDRGAPGMNGEVYYLFATPKAKQRLNTILTKVREAVAKLPSSTHGD